MKDWSKYQIKNVSDKHNTLLDYLEDINFSCVIDLGCGSGNDTVYLIKRGFNVIAIDRQINKELILN